MVLTQRHSEAKVTDLLVVEGLTLVVEGLLVEVGVGQQTEWPIVRGGHSGQ